MKGSKAPKEHNYVRKLHYLYRIGAIPREGGAELIREDTKAAQWRR